MRVRNQDTTTGWLNGTLSACTSFGSAGGLGLDPKLLKSDASLTTTRCGCTVNSAGGLAGSATDDASEKLYVESRTLLAAFVCKCGGAMSIWLGFDLTEDTLPRELNKPPNFLERGAADTEA
jgi:hypothetical protein